MGVAPVHAQNLVDSGQQFPGIWAGDAAWGDYDDDGDLDLVLIGEIAEENQLRRIARIYRNDEGIFSEELLHREYLTGVYFGDVAWADYDSDGDLDLAIVGWDGGNRESLRLYTTQPDNIAPNKRIVSLDRLQNGDGQPTLKGVRYSTLAWGDYDGDGDPDLVVSGMEENGTSLTLLYRNNDGVLQIDETNNETIVGLHNGDLAWGDYDNDGDLDLAVSGENVTTTGGLGAVTEFYKNEPVGTLKLDLFVDVETRVKGGAMSWTDYDNDGDSDLAISGRVTDWMASWNTSFLLYSNHPTGLLTQDETFRLSTTRRITGDLAWADYDNDGDPDLAASGRTVLSSYQAFVFKNEAGQLSGVSTETQLEGLAGGSTAWGDYDGDGRTDLLISGIDADGERRTLLYNNQGTFSANRLPTPPSSLNPVKVTSGRVIFSWAPGADAESNSLTYNLRVGTEPGSGDVFSGTIPPGPGNAGSKIGRSLEVALPPDVYYWSVQTVDGAFARSTWSQEDVLNIQQFVSSEQRLWALKEAAMAWGDYDDDGDLDLVTLGQNRSGEAQSLLYDNVGGVLTQAPGVPLSPLRNGGVAWGDYDNDGDLDLLLTGEDTFENRRTLLYAAVLTGSGYSLELVGQFPDLSKSGAAWGDYDNDGDLDLALIGQSDDVLDGVQQSYTWIFVNDGLGSFTRGDQDLIGLNNGDLAWADFDNDQDLDLAVTGSSATGSRELRVYRNDDGILVDAELGLAGLESSDLAWADFDGDGDADLVAGGIGDNGVRTTLYVNDGNGGLEPLNGLDLPGIRGGDLAWGDYDNDQDLDLIIVGNDGQNPFVSIYKYKDDTLVPDNIPILQGLDFSAVSFADIEGDGDLDLISTGRDISLLTRAVVNDNLGALIKANQPPTIPLLLAATDSADAVRLSWAMADDEGETTPASLTYNLRVGNVPGSGDILSGNVPLGAGNAGHNLSHRLQGLPSGTYYWSVQSIDDGFARSDWSTPQNFTIDAAAPEVSLFALSHKQLSIGQTVALALGILDEHSGVTPDIIPQVTATLDGQEFIFQILDFTGETWSGQLTITSEMPSGEATIVVRGVVDRKGNEMAPYSVGNAFNVDTIPLAVISSSPEMEATDVPVETRELTVTFSEPIDPTTLTTDNLRIEFDGQPLPQLTAPAYDLKTLTARLFLVEGLQPGARYTVEISPVIQDLAGNRPEKSISWSFSTRVPQLIATHPAAEDTAVNTADGRISARFDMPILLSSGSIRFLSLGIDEAISSVLFDADTHTLSFEPEAGLRSGVSYQVILSGALGGQLRVQNEGDYSWNFSTQIPRVARVDPPDGTAVQSGPRRLQVTFSSPPDLDLITPQNFRLIRNGSSIKLEQDEFAYDADTYTISFPSIDLLPGSEYQVTVSPRVSGPLGADLPEMQWSFSTQLPQVVSTWPEDGAEGVSIAADILQIEFSEPVARRDPADFQLFTRDLGDPLAAPELVPITTPSVRKSGDGEILAFAPVGGLRPFAEYRVTVARQVFGERAESDYVWSFNTTARLADTRQGGTVTSADASVALAFPPNALQGGTGEIAIRSLRPSDLPVPRGDSTPVGLAYEIDMATGTLHKPATLTMRYSEEGLGTATPENLRIFYLVNDTWQLVGGTAEPGKRVVQTAIEAAGTFALLEDQTSPAGRSTVRDLRCQPRMINPALGWNTMSISFLLTGSAEVSVQIFNMAGQLQRQLLADRKLGPGSNVVQWDGRDEAGKYSNAGMYIVLVKAGGKTKKLVVGVL